MGRGIPESELRQMFEIAADGSVGRFRGQDRVFQAIMAGAKRPDYARMKIPALSIQSIAPESVSEGRALKVLIPGRWPNVGDVSESALNELFAAVRKTSRAQTDTFEKEFKGARNVELVGANHYDFLSNPDDVLREIRKFLKGVVR
jgi:hypothetical protein